MEEEKEDISAAFFREEKGNLLDILSSAVKAIKYRDILKLKELSNRTVHSASIYQNPESITLAVLIYSLGKIMERTDYMSYSNWKIFVKSCIKNLKEIRSALSRGEIEKFQTALKNMRKNMINLAGPMRMHIEEVFRRAMINKASRLYEHGISQSKTADMLGVSVWELADYVGKTGIPDVNLSITQDIKTRISRAARLFENIK